LTLLLVRVVLAALQLDVAAVDHERAVRLGHCRRRRQPADEDLHVTGHAVGEVEMENAPADHGGLGDVGRLRRERECPQPALGVVDRSR
jgi:hypothetical protein